MTERVQGAATSGGQSGAREKIKTKAAGRQLRGAARVADGAFPLDRPGFDSELCWLLHWESLGKLLSLV